MLSTVHTRAPYLFVCLLAGGCPQEIASTALQRAVNACGAWGMPELLLISRSVQPDGSTELQRLLKRLVTLSFFRPAGPWYITGGLLPDVAAAVIGAGKGGSVELAAALRAVSRGSEQLPLLVLELGKPGEVGPLLAAVPEDRLKQLGSGGAEAPAPHLGKPISWIDHGADAGGGFTAASFLDATSSNSLQAGKRPFRISSYAGPLSAALAELQRNGQPVIVAACQEHGSSGTASILEASMERISANTTSGGRNLPELYLRSQVGALIRKCPYAHPDMLLVLMKPSSGGKADSSSGSGGEGDGSSGSGGHSGAGGSSGSSISAACPVLLVCFSQPGETEEQLQRLSSSFHQLAQDALSAAAAAATAAAAAAAAAAAEKAAELSLPVVAWDTLLIKNAETSLEIPGKLLL